MEVDYADPAFNYAKAAPDPTMVQVDSTMA